MRVALYVRVSTTEQAEEGFSVENQKQKLILYCGSQGWDDYTLYVDDGFTGTKMDRPALKRMRRHIEEGKLDMVVVHKLDRLGRKQLDVLFLINLFEEHKVAFKSATEPFDTSTPLGKAMIGILAVFAQLERDMIIERTTMGRRQRTESGLWYGGRSPYGYDWNKEAETLVIREDQAYIIREIYDQYLKGKSRMAISDWAISRTTDRVFDHGVIRDMLSRPLYIGKLVSNGALVEGNHESIIDDETFYRVQIEAGRRKEGMGPVGDYLLTGLLKCGICGCGVVHVIRKTTKNNRSYTYELYACKNQHVRQKDRTNHCTLGYKRRDVVEAFIISKIKNISLERNEFRPVNLPHNNEETNAEVRVTLEAKLLSATVGLENLYDAVQNGTIKGSNVGDRIKNLEAARESIERQLEDVKDAEPKYIEPETFIDMVEEMGEVWDVATYEEQKMMMRNIVKSVTLFEDGEIKVAWLTRI